MKKLHLTVLTVICAICMALGAMMMLNLHAVSANTAGATPVLSETKVMRSNDNSKMLLATAIKDFDDVYEVGYTGIEDEDKVVAETKKYYTTIASGANSWSAEDIFGAQFEGAGMIIWEINFAIGTEYSFKPYALVGERDDQSQLIEPTEEVRVTPNDDVVKQYFNVTISANEDDYGTVNATSLVVAKGTEVTVSENVITIGNVVITATKTADDTDYIYAFSNFTGHSATITADTEIIANFIRTERENLQLSVSKSDIYIGNLATGDAGTLGYSSTSVVTVTGANSSLTYTSSNETVATVTNDGTITVGTKSGDVTITVTSELGSTKSVDLKVWRYITQASELQLIYENARLIPETNNVDGTRKMYDGYYVLGNNIDATGTTLVVPAGIACYSGYYDSASASIGGVYRGYNRGFEGFQGIFDGNNHEVKGLTVGEESGTFAYGVFGTIGQKGIVRNVAFLMLNNAHRNDCAYAGLALNVFGGTIDTVTFHASSVNFFAPIMYLGGGSTLKDCVFYMWNGQSMGVAHMTDINQPTGSGPATIINVFSISYKPSINPNCAGYAEVMDFNIDYTTNRKGDGLTFAEAGAQFMANCANANLWRLGTGGWANIPVLQNSTIA